LLPHIQRQRPHFLTPEYNPRYILEGLSKDKCVAVSHFGSLYREGLERMTIEFNKLVDVTFVTVDTLDVGAKNPIWLGQPINLDYIKPVYKRGSDKVIISHFPTKWFIKGSVVVRTAIYHYVKNQNFEFRYRSKLISWEENIEEVSKCDIYIDDLQGDWLNVSAIEAAALGKIVITKFTHADKYKENFGIPCQVQTANGPKELGEKIDELLSMSASERLALKRKSRKWVEQVHSYKAFGNRLVKIYREILDAKLQK
jgi:glycosyltransferase involved in cell wall biosynthesis